MHLDEDSQIQASGDLITKNSSKKQVLPSKRNRTQDKANAKAGPSSHSTDGVIEPTFQHNWHLITMCIILGKKSTKKSLVSTNGAIQVMNQSTPFNTKLSHLKVKDEEDKIVQHAGAPLVITYQMAQDHQTSWRNIQLQKDYGSQVSFYPLIYQKCQFWCKEVEANWWTCGMPSPWVLQ